MPCITNDTTLEVEQLDDSTATIYYLVVSEEEPLTITFTCSGTIKRITIDPQPPQPVGHSITFTHDQLDQIFVVSVDYSGGTRTAPLDETPTKLPKFKPVTSCPS
ncbi:MAG: hypothetical protein R6X02_27125 [Enhygromyxa sp.]